MKFIWLIISSLLISNSLLAQDSSYVKKQKAFFIGVGSAQYKGDLGDGYGGGNLVVHAGLKFNNEKRFNGNLQLTIGQVSGNELDYTFDDGSGNPTSPNTYFKSSLIGFHFEAQYNIIDRDKLKIYLAQGIGILRFSPKDEFGHDLSDNNETRPLNESYGNITIMLPTSLGIKYELSNSWSLGLQSSFLNTMTDYIDNISQWGSNDKNDNIFYTRLNIYIPIKF
ncbi:MAG: hypothetical protein OCD76_06170 [Reichenbachiella sp.]